MMVSVAASKDQTDSVQKAAPLTSWRLRHLNIQRQINREPTPTLMKSAFICGHGLIFRYTNPQLYGYLVSF
jgi:hypothetical protein